MPPSAAFTEADETGRSSARRALEDSSSNSMRTLLESPPKENASIDIGFVDDDGDVDLAKMCIDLLPKKCISGYVGSAEYGEDLEHTESLIGAPVREIDCSSSYDPSDEVWDHTSFLRIPDFAKQ